MNSHSDFYWGLLVGVVGAGILGRILNQIVYYYKRSGDADRPQEVKLKTELTPNQVRHNAFVASCTTILYVIALLLVVAVLYWAVTSFFTTY